MVWSRRAFKLALLAWAISALLTSTYPAMAYALSDEVAVEYSVEENILSVNSYFYTVRIDLETGRFVYVDVRTVDGGTRTLLDAGAGMEAYLISVGSQGLGSPVGGWQVVSAVDSDTFSTVALRSTVGAAVVEARLTFYSYKPQIDVEVEITNDSGERVQLQSPFGGPALVFASSVEEGSLYKTAYTVVSGGEAKIEAVDLESRATFSGIESIVVVTEYQGEPRVLLGLKDVHGDTVAVVDPNYQVSAGEGETATQLTLVLGFVNQIFEPGSKDSFKASLVLSVYDAYAIISTDVFDEVASIYPGIKASVPTGFGFERTIADLNSRIETLRSSLDNLRSENEELKRKLDELQGRDDYWNAKIAELEEELQFYKIRSERNGILALLAFIAGAVISAAAVYTVRR
ncbi:hypothetical protein [Aeropyrum camini]|uniref:Uncharacterized protein n=1 Tax=Aeropyrum camini SY1 = JCM 12091 TaxID=1198449 RepID=U3TEE1_9CREN|nr:hypothetical protein [Aeropyrum camini]BAN90811.1 hypothetical protein ACAM_1342 [Aeropyrum camini SY1 = JCM 12091]